MSLSLELPNGWQVIRLDQICIKITDGSHFSPPSQQDTAYRIATVKDMRMKGFDFSTCAQISREDFDKLKSNGCNPIANDVLFSKDGTIGKTFVFDGKQEIVLLSSIAIIRPAVKKVNPYFLSQFLRSNLFYTQLEGLKSGSAIRRLVLKAIKEIKVLLPTLEEQEKIANVLSTLDEKIEVIEDQIIRTTDLKKGLMQQLLTEGIGHTQFKASPLGEIPENWEIRRFEDETELITCGVAATPKYVDESIGIPFLSAQNVQDGKVVLDKFKYISKELHCELTKNNKPEKGDILYSRVGAKFGEAGVVEHNFEFSIYVSLTLIKVKKSNDAYYIKHLLNSESVKNLALRSVFQGAGVPNLNVKVVRDFRLPFPPQEEQIKIASILSTVDEKIEVLRTKKERYQELKKGLMQQLLIGKIRVNQTNSKNDSTKSQHLQTTLASV